MAETFTSLPTVFKRKGYSYVMLVRGTQTLLYEQRVGQITVGFEVFKIMIDKPKDIMGKQIPARERFPKNEDFGFTAWAYKDKSRAMEKYYELEKVAAEAETIQHR